jgi:hypothetical protein
MTCSGCSESCKAREGVKQMNENGFQLAELVGTVLGNSASITDSIEKKLLVRIADLEHENYDLVLENTYLKERIETLIQRYL